MKVQLIKDQTEKMHISLFGIIAIRKSFDTTTSVIRKAIIFKNKNSFEIARDCLSAHKVVYSALYAANSLVVSDDYNILVI